MSVRLSDPGPSAQNPPVKRKRGRPPKANKPEDAFPTFTMQLESSPLTRSPNAELTSSQVVKIGEPNSFMPMMKVLPSPHRKKRRKSSNFSLPLQPPQIAKISELLTPASRAYVAESPLHSRVLDNLSTIMKEQPHDLSIPSPAGDGSLRPGIVLVGPNLLPERAARQSFDDTIRHESVDLHSELAGIFHKELHKERGFSNQAAVQELSWNTNAPSNAREDMDLFGFELVIDENGQATLADRHSTSYPENHGHRSNVAADYTEQTSRFSGSARSASSGFHAVERTQSLPVLGTTETSKSTGPDADTYRISNFIVSPKVEINPDDYNHAYSAELDSSLYHMMDLHTHVYKRGPQSPQQFSMYPQDPLPLKKQDPYDRFSVDTLDLVIDEHNPDVLIESADARSALRKVVRRE